MPLFCPFWFLTNKKASSQACCYAVYIRHMPDPT
nr:MAG TPA: hypothetical protein [Caudoviricetes sp.]DAU14107.1 MAG TPA: 54S ribosomal protein [Caudoviricetes sp.]DAZ32016.1 MAG TPA: 54S ribosomal protein [Caudoviricetes sp.]